MSECHAFFELRRRIDGLVYEFDRIQRHDGTVGYKRRDKDLWINWHGELGWVAWDARGSLGEYQKRKVLCV